MKIVTISEEELFISIQDYYLMHCKLKTEEEKDVLIT